MSELMLCAHTISIESLQIIHSYTTSSCLWWCLGAQMGSIAWEKHFLRKNLSFFLHFHVQNIHEVLPIMHAIAYLENIFMIYIFFHSSSSHVKHYWKNWAYVAIERIFMDKNTLKSSVERSIYKYFGMLYDK